MNPLLDLDTQGPTQELHGGLLGGQLALGHPRDQRLAFAGLAAAPLLDHALDLEAGPLEPVGLEQAVLHQVLVVGLEGLEQLGDALGFGGRWR